jgi:hypothetical protein
MKYHLTLSLLLISIGFSKKANAQLSVPNGDVLYISSSTTVYSQENLVNSGTINGGGTLSLNGSNSTTITGTGTIDKLSIDKTSATVTISTGTTSITNNVTVNSGTLAAGGKLTLKSTSSGTAYVGTFGSGATLTGDVNCELYVQGKRAFRFLAHPFNASIALSQITDDFDITGSGGSTNGFTSTGTNNPSSFWFDETIADATTSGNNAGWTAFTNTDGNGTNSWNAKKGLRVLVRGASGEGLTTTNYTPSAVTVDFTGNINQGNITESFSCNSNTKFVVATNPYPAPVQVTSLSYTNMGNYFYVWDVSMGTRGAYSSKAFSSSYVLPAYASFNTEVSALGGTGSIGFTEAAKVASTSPASGHFLEKDSQYQLEINVFDDKTYWDQLRFYFHDQAAAAYENWDAVKFTNPDVNFYSVSNNNHTLSIDSRPFEHQKTIPLGFKTTLKKDYSFAFDRLQLPEGYALYLKDYYLNKTVEITHAGKYDFTVNADSLSQGDTRFEIQAIDKFASTQKIKNSNLYKIGPNPTNGNWLNIYYPNVNALIEISDLNGKVLLKGNLQKQKTAESLNIEELKEGIYIVKIKQGNTNVFTQKLIKL